MTKKDEPAITRASTADELELAACRRLYSEAAAIIYAYSQSKCVYDSIPFDPDERQSLLHCLVGDRRLRMWQDAQAKFKECSTRLTKLKEKGIDVEKLFF